MGLEPTTFESLLLRLSRSPTRYPLRHRACCWGLTLFWLYPAQCFCVCWASRVQYSVWRSRRTWSEVGLAVEANDAVFLSSHQNVISNFHVQSVWIQTGYWRLLLLGWGRTDNNALTTTSLKYFLHGLIKNKLHCLFLHFTFSFFSFSFLVFPARREARSMRGVLGVEVTDEGVWSTALEIFDTGAKIPAGQKERRIQVKTQRETTVWFVFRRRLRVALPSLGGQMK